MQETRECADAHARTHLHRPHTLQAQVANAARHRSPEIKLIVA